MEPGSKTIMTPDLPAAGDLGKLWASSQLVALPHQQALLILPVISFRQSFA